MDKRKRGMQALLLALLFMGVGTFTSSWWTMSRSDRSWNIGLTNGTRCHGDNCQTEPLDKTFPERHDTFLMLGTVIKYGSLATGLCLLLALAVAFAERESTGRFSAAEVGVLLSGVMFFCAVMFIYNAPEELHEGMSWGYSRILYQSGALLGTVGSIFLARSEKVAPADRPADKPAD